VKVSVPPRAALPRPGPTPAIRVGSRSSLLLLLTTLFGVAAFGWPLLIHQAAGQNSAHSGDAPWVFVGLLPLVFGRGFGFVLGAVAFFASGLITGGVGPWLPFQMLAAGWVGFGAGCLPPMRGFPERLLLATYGVVAALVYGVLTNFWFWPFVGSTTTYSFVPGLGTVANLHRFILFDLTTSMGFDLTRAVTCAILILVLGRPVLAALRRASRRAAFEPQIDFIEESDSKSGQ